MNLIEIYISVDCSSYRDKEVYMKISKQKIIKETAKQIKVDTFGMFCSSIISKESLDKIQCVGTLTSINRWIHVREDANYNEENLKSLLLSDIKDEINNRRDLLVKMCNIVDELLKTI
ncbi:hypothetical protein [Clostridium tagluense]|uniref:Uncharacterized protein n=1 Tax=Clostridium tagluense TaxID=360422 RepID=A0A401UTM0_9CLOT|nr:hypothetical protein [Clostridium tagluense]GCD12900.1 hypothetical protein Ctaglu_45230 [Clostridium tagluense]